MKNILRIHKLIGSCQNDKLSSTQKLMMRTMLDYADNETLFCYPSIRRIARECNISFSTAKENMKYLCKEGYLIKTHNRVRQKQYKNNHYIINESKFININNPDKSNPPPKNKVQYEEFDDSQYEYGNDLLDEYFNFEPEKLSTTSNHTLLVSEEGGPAIGPGCVYDRPRGGPITGPGVGQSPAPNYLINYSEKLSQKTSSSCDGKPSIKHDVVMDHDSSGLASGCILGQAPTTYEPPAELAVPISFLEKTPEGELAASTVPNSRDPDPSVAKSLIAIREQLEKVRRGEIENTTLVETHRAEGDTPSSTGGSGSKENNSPKPVQPYVTRSRYTGPVRDMGSVMEGLLTRLRRE